MDQDYKRMMYGAFFDELYSAQFDKLEKVALGPIAGAAKGFKMFSRHGIGKGMQTVAKIYGQGAKRSGVLGGIGRVLRTPYGKALGATALGAGTLAAGAGAAGGLAVGGSGPRRQ